VLVSVGLKASSRPSGGLAPLSAVSLTDTEPNLRRLIEKLDSQPLITLLRAPPALPSSLLGGAEGPELDPSVRKVRRPRLSARSSNCSPARRRKSSSSRGRWRCTRRTATSRR
jgi:hypothetical protein